MPVEKLLLHILIILLPVFMYNIFFDKKRWNTPWLCGILQSSAAVLCMAFPAEIYGLNWDLRYVPLILTVLYAGSRAGWFVFAAILMARTIIGGENLFYGYLSLALAVMIPFLISKKFWGFSPRKRIVMAVAAGIWASIVPAGILAAYLILKENHIVISDILNIALFGILQIMGLGIASYLNEAVIEKNRMKEEIKRAEKLSTLGELAASVAHEVRNPLTVVKGFLQLMEKEEKGRNKEYLSLVLSEMGRAEGIISDYLNFAKPEFKKLETVELCSFLEEVALLLEPLASKEGVLLERDLKEASYLETDRNQFKQAIVNLVKNAIEATPEGGKVIISHRAETGGSRIVIADSGKGMNNEELARIGTLFYTTKDRGTGLGTAVSVRIIQEMKGKITYESKPGAGTRAAVFIHTNPSFPSSKG